MADVSLSERQALQLDNTLVPPGGDRRIAPGLWSVIRRMLLNNGTVTLTGEASEVTVTLPVPMPSTDFRIFANIRNAAGIGAAMLNGVANLVVEVDSVSTIKIYTFDASGNAVNVPVGESLQIDWCVRE